MSRFLNMFLGLIVLISIIRSLFVILKIFFAGSYSNILLPVDVLLLL